MTAEEIISGVLRAVLPPIGQLNDHVLDLTRTVTEVKADLKAHDRPCRDFRDHVADHPAPADLQAHLKAAADETQEIALVKRSVRQAIIGAVGPAMRLVLVALAVAFLGWLGWHAADLKALIP